MGFDAGLTLETFLFSMKHFSGFGKIFENKKWYFWGNIKILLGHLDRGLGTKGPHSDRADKIFLGLHIVRHASKWSNLLLKMGEKLLSLASVLIQIYGSSIRNSCFKITRSFIHSSARSLTDGDGKRSFYSLFISWKVLINEDMLNLHFLM